MSRRKISGIALAVTVALSAAPAFAQKVTPPPPGAPREARLPQPVEKTLENGLRVIVVPKHNIPLVAAQLLVRSGGAAETAGREGLARLTAALVTKGTAELGAQQIAREVEALGATLESGAGWDSSTINLSVMSNNFAPAMQYLATSARNAAFAKEELELERAQMVDALQVIVGQPRSVADIVAARVVFGETPYGHNLNGTPKSLAAISRDDVVAFHKEHYRPDNAVLVIAGDVKPDAAVALATKLFGTWNPSGAKSDRATAPAKKDSGARRIVVVDMPEAGQASVVVTRKGIRRTDPAYYQALVANSVLGGGYSARLNQEIRIKRGLAYGAGSAFQARADVGPFVAMTNTKNETAGEAADLIVSMMTGLAAAEVPESELTPRKATLIGEFAQSLETSAGIVDQIGDLALYGLPLADINGFIGGVQAVSAKDLATFSKKALDGAAADVVIVGDLSSFREDLEKRLGSFEVIPIAELDLTSPTLRVRKEKE